jgi:glyoxylate reductase
MSSMKRKPLVVVTRRLPDAVETRMRELFDTRLNHDDAPLSPEALATAIREADVLVPTVTDEINAGLLAQAGPNLRLIANFGNGVDHIDVGAALERGITVTNTPGVLTEDTADMTMALILAVARRIAEGARIIPDDDWTTGWSPTWMLGRRITGKRLGIVGMGRIGQALARRAKAFGLSIHYHNRRRAPTAIEEALDATYWESLDQMLARVDVIDENALARLIEAGEISAAGLDVFEQEPAVSPRLVRLARTGKVVLLPHMGSATHESRTEMGEKVIINIKTFMDGHRPPDRILPSML